jgi:hypothetical protein
MKKWKQAPKKSEVETELKSFFALLQAGKLDAAKAALAHHSDDWESQIWSIWQDTYLIYLEELDQEVEDDSFEGKGWLNDLSWLADLAIEDSFHWDDDGDQVNPEGENLFVNLIYKGELLDVSGDFRVVKDDDGYHLMREIIHTA